MTICVNIKSKKYLLHLSIKCKYLKIWFDILTPKQFLFFEPFIKKLERNHTLLCTSRNYKQVKDITNFGTTNLLFLGKHGGSEKFGKLAASLDRSKLLAKKINEFKPDLTISFCSPEASRVSFGLGVKHIAFNDSPYASAVMKLSLPFVDKLLIPWIYPKNDFQNYGIDKKNIIQYKAIDAAIIIKREITLKDSQDRKSKKTILIRPEETEASYVSKQSNVVSIIEKIIHDFPNSNKLVLTRYRNQSNSLKNKFSENVQIISKVVDGKKLLLSSDVFVGSGGTMTAESALLGVPTISYNAVPNGIENYLVTKNIVVRCMTPNSITKNIKKIFSYSKKSEFIRKKRIEKFVKSLDDPYPILLKAIKSIIK